jgi:hypothetical protein
MGLVFSGALFEMRGASEASRLLSPDDPIIGGANKQIILKANALGCYK